MERGPFCSGYQYGGRESAIDSSSTLICVSGAQNGEAVMIYDYADLQAPCGPQPAMRAKRNNPPARSASSAENGPPRLTPPRRLPADGSVSGARRQKAAKRASAAVPNGILRRAQQKRQKDEAALRSVSRGT
ncbi:hypothetical protein SKAU_G00006050 [Synaphobranchus kaupii]|uniref:Uncharacterized protein n=1 Tax=Synaphobranchus kaupii TaxID=118154 RepID=A0A9Q1JCV1_SYNKA|nr:hypothetical protein SKAU_G00006050 [Synaphobranchus kaupii]